ncbi:MAG: class I SAM-dependent methyltransferase [Chloroflexi bacterium]|nr:class I SAM-dependent methyltransferase [Chloroflexota bacterium]
MDEATQRHLNAINREFYRSAAADFAATRQQAWPGWERMLASLDVPVASALDIGCGNGRLPRFLAGRQGGSFAYCGIDNCAELLAIAQRQLDDLPNLRLKLIERDVILDGLAGPPAQLVTLFGLLHHVPGARQRRDLLRSAARFVLPGGTLVFAAWRFYEQERFRRRILPWDAGIAVEKHDYLLDWRRGTRALRYCHYIDDSEHEQLIEASGLCAIDDYRADGADGDLNRYTVLRKNKAERA